VVVLQMAAEPKTPEAAPAAAVRRFVRRHLPYPVVRAYRALRDGHAIEMHGVPREDLVALLARHGAAVLDAREDTSAGGGWTSFLYCAAKRGAAPDGG
jgi:hypothetical protein